MTASSAFFLVSSHQRDAVPPTVHLLGTEVSLVAAYSIALLLFLLLGGFALSVLNAAGQNLRELNPSGEIRAAVLRYPSLATSDNALFRVGTVLFCPIAVLSAVFIDVYRDWGKLMAAKDIGHPLIGWAGLLLVILVVYGRIANRVWRPFGKGPR
jgi:hypothetical protein